MSTPLPTMPATRAEIDERLVDRWRWFLGLGVLFVLLGTVGFLMMGPLSLVAVLYIAALFLVGGVVQIVHALRVKCWRSSASHVAGAVLYLIAGVLLLASPLIGLVTVTLFVGAAILATGIMRIVIGFQHRPDPGWTWLAVSGLVGVLLGLLILAGLPGNALWILGLIVAVELLMEGWSMILMGLALRRWKRSEGAATA